MEISEKKKIAECFSAEFRGMVTSGMYLCFCANFLFYGVTYLVPQLALLKNWDYPVLVLVSVCLCETIGNFGSITLVTLKFSHQSTLLYILASCATCTSLMLFGDMHDITSLTVAATSLCAVCNAAYFAVLYLFLSEVFPTSIRGTACSICFSGGRIGAIVVPLLLEGLRDIDALKLKPNGAITPFLSLLILVTFIGMAIIFNLDAEVKNKPLSVFSETSKAKVRKRSKDLLQDSDAIPEYTGSSSNASSDVEPQSLTRRSTAASEANLKRSSTSSDANNINDPATDSVA